MDNDELESVLSSRFESLRQAPQGSSVVPQVMARVDAAAFAESLQTTRRRERDWVLGFAILLGALVCVPSLQALDVAALLRGIPMDVFGPYADTAMALAVPLLIAAVLLPFSLLVLDDS